MDAWSNIEISANDPEVISRNRFEKELGELRDQISRIRKLITRFEACHFKYHRHLQMIKDAIITLKSSIVPNEIEINHIRHGERAWKNDTTGKSLIGRQYLWGIKSWLNDGFQDGSPGHFDRLLMQKIHNWLGDKSPDKERLVRLLLAGLTWDRKSCEVLQHGGEFKQLEYEVARMDICHYSSPKNIDLLLQGIGCMQPLVKEGLKVVVCTISISNVIWTGNS
ncbi:MAG: hypothetical protein AAF731_10565 [Bacteroidota bacterium]